MGWKGVTIMDQRVRFIAEYLKGCFPFNELCLQFSISRKTGYKWVMRYIRGGSEALSDQSTRPNSCPHERMMLLFRQLCRRV
jgi:transposase-like protein